MPSPKFEGKRITKSNVLVIILTIIISVLFYSLYIYSLRTVSNGSNYGHIISLLGWLGIFLYAYILITWFKITNVLFTPYIIFMSFFFLFNYGQSFMWAFGVHIPNEIGDGPIYPGYGVVEDIDIVKTQSLTLISILMFHLGATLSHKKNINFKIMKLFTEKKIGLENESKELKVIFYASVILGFISIPVSLYYSYLDFKVASIYGYKALYYSEFANEGSMLGVSTKMFFPCLVGLLLGSRFNKNVRLIVYSIFSCYLILNVATGDRGSWIYKIIILIWLSHSFHKKIKIKTLFNYLFISVISVYILNIIVSLRNIGVSNLDISKLRDLITFEVNPLIQSVFEMGGSMRPTLFLQMNGWDIWPYANSYLLAFLGMITNKVIYAFDLPFSLISSWFSQNYLGLTWGAGFSIIAEALMNFGPIIAPLFMILIGYLLSTLIYIDNTVRYESSSMKVLFVASTLHAFIPVTRNYFHLLLKDWFYGVIVLFVFILFIDFLLTITSKNIAKTKNRGAEL